MIDPTQNELNHALHKLVMAQQGQLRALQVAHDALLGTLFKSMPGLLPVLAENLSLLAGPGIEGLEDEATEAYAAAIGKQLAHLRVYG